MALNTATKIKFQQALDTGVFSSEDFEFLESQSYDDAVISIIYRFNKKYKMSITIGSNGVIEIEQSPGSILDKENHSKKDTWGVITSIKNWLDLMETDMNLSPSNRILEEKHKIFEETLKRIESSVDKIDKDVLFTSSESKELAIRLTKLEETFKVKLEEEHQDKNKLNQEMANLSKEIELLKNQLDSFTKGNWVKAFTTKVYTWSRRNPNTVKALGGAALEMLPPDIKEHFPVEILHLEEGTSSDNNIGSE
ncbi:hypothetical protein J7E78_07665 [Paenibacillus polymyxa]|uniref:hypothetical protein n=1 Tax=Paenibacillus polymyxa TaxID=1406 RepID=UPI001BEB8F4D|nr:hypothetical protein [Paenibacillus polymyxa]MBT2283413.1 hypothetical protein [Paenibacillus polymyxa]